MLISSSKREVEASIQVTLISSSRREVVQENKIRKILLTTAPTVPVPVAVVVVVVVVAVVVVVVVAVVVMVVAAAAASVSWCAVVGLVIVILSPKKNIGCTPILMILMIVIPDLN